MQTIAARWLFDGEKVVENMAFTFDKKIVAIEPAEVLETRFPDVPIERFGADTIVMPGLINPHTHLEFGANTTQLAYGDFMPWLNSVIDQRDSLIDRCRAACYKRQIDAMLQSGITTFGAVSSYGKEMRACRAAPQRVVYFNEAIGSQPAAVDALYHDFTARLQESHEMADERFIPAVAIHSPYSVHPILMKKILEEYGDLPLTAHFMESPAEKEWLEQGSGPFKSFFENLLKQNRPLTTPEAFLELLDGKKTLLTHAVQADDALLDTIADAGHSIIHCPRSNRLLGCGRLALEKLESRGIQWMLGTDGLSSNTSLDLWDEMRAALMMHHDADLESLARSLLRGSTSIAADALGLPVGRIAEGMEADIAIVTLPADLGHANQAVLQTVLHTHTIQRLYIQGKAHVR
jgi:cytosine/adenosine deaminase-related metal-dependent hydrolase